MTTTHRTQLRDRPYTRAAPRRRLLPWWRRLATQVSRYDSSPYKIVWWEWVLLADGTVWFRVERDWDCELGRYMPNPSIWCRVIQLSTAGRQQFMSGQRTAAELLAEAVTAKGHYLKGSEPPARRPGMPSGGDLL